MSLTESEQQALRREMREAVEAMSAMFERRLAEQQAARVEGCRPGTPAGRARRRSAAHH